MIELKPGHWSHPDDLRRSVAGRDDPPELVEHCVTHLEERTPVEMRKRVHRSEGLLRSAMIKRRATRPGHVDVLRASLAEKDAVIDRLLAYVQARKQALPDDRLAKISKLLLSEAKRLFGPGDYIPMVVPETDPDTTEAHRILITADPEHSDPNEWARASLALQGYAAEILTPHELEAMRVLVMPAAR